MFRYQNDCGESYDTLTAPNENWAIWNGATVNTDVTVGQYIDSGSVIFAPQTGAAASIVSSAEVIVMFRAMIPPTPTNNFLLLGNGIGDYGGVGMSVAGQFVVAGITTNPLPFDPAASWHYYEIKFSASNSLGGILEIRVDGVMFFQVSGVTTAAATWDVSLVGFNVHTKFRDFCILDTTGVAPTNNFIGEVTVGADFPNSDATPNQFTDTFGGAGSHFAAVNATVPTGDASYLNDNVVGHEESFGHSNLPGSAVVVYAVSPKVSAKKSVGVARTLAMRYDNGAVAYGSDFAVGAGTYIEYVPEILEVDPNTGLPWTVSGYNLTNFGFAITG